MSNGVQAGLTPYIKAAGAQAVRAQRWGEEFNSGFYNLTNTISRQAQRGLAPAVSASQATFSPVVGAANEAGKHLAQGVGAGLEGLGPVITGLEEGTRPFRVSRHASPLTRRT